MTFRNLAPFLLITTISCVFAATLTVEETTKSHIAAMRKDGSLTNVVNALVADGTFCAIRQHSFQSHLHVTLEYVSNKAGCRECSMCGLHQTMYLSDWK